MEPIRLQLQDLGLLAPELTLVVAAVILSLLDLLLPRQAGRTWLGWLSLISIAISAVFVVLYQLNPAEPKQLLLYSYRIDDFASIIKLVLLVGAGLVTFMSIGSVREEEVPHVGEYYYLLLPATIGGMIMASSGELITLFVGLELLSITSYILVAMRKKNWLTNEAAFKYIVLGGISSAVILYGMSFLYGMTGSTVIPQISSVLERSGETLQPMIYLSFFLLLAGFGFKAAAAPFHMWAPDVYQGSFTPVTAFLAVVSKAAAFAILFRVMYTVFASPGIMGTPIHSDFLLGMMVVAAAAMIVGNFVALRQTNLKRLLAYSGIANSGYLLVPIAVQFSIVHFSNFAEFVYYLIAYLFMNIGMFAVLMIIERSTGEEDLKGFAGLYYRAPGMAVATVLLVLSLAGLPVSAGFFGKLFILLGAMQTQHYWLGAILIATSVISFYYYFGLIRQMFMRSDDASAPIRPALPLSITMWLCAAASVLLGLFPQGVLAYIEQIFTLTQDLFMFS
ncbi:NADH-quinone oxidoreductase subunit N [Paenibacillus validus]|uniref:NADH-quinone oxidoreductase subunit N n=1 Tax=Paenibacillus validus TaxID=44253 RepID=A0A7X2ZCP3_9BACL|nr:MULTISPECIES: NADH-quinone oxidoreductase subunit N [Paenibacillus]MED4601467.1 NADH-quinone oxidoreductase subunit N [Paenibacillus validus]MED4606989.1 NADH-quinone oxidoreductase subunit N [Paenibacillus validus]MUG72437.1 NADH-quinone oxidoreductase subunit NuoN [Paenibacillus validus]